MSIRGSKETAPDSGQKLFRLICLLICGATGASAACASAAVESQRLDAAQGGGSGGSGKGGAGGSSGGQGGKKDTTNRDATYGACDPFTNEGCSGDQKCAALQTGSELTLGCGSKEDKGENEGCTQLVEDGTQTGDDCAEGLSCFGAPPTCHRPCTTSQCCPSDEICGGAAPGLPSLGWCQPFTQCKPLKQEGCPDGQACYFTSTSCYTGALCTPAGNKQPGETCSLSNECRPGSTCLLVGSSGTCASFCSTQEGGTPECTGADTGGDICDPIAGGTEEDLGLCRQQP
jgi:hypothetical protein